jgi:hypothetical protein
MRRASVFVRCLHLFCLLLKFSHNVQKAQAHVKTFIRPYLYHVGLGWLRNLLESGDPDPLPWVASYGGTTYF